MKKTVSDVRLGFKVALSLIRQGAALRNYLWIDSCGPRTTSCGVVSTRSRRANMTARERAQVTAIVRLLDKTTRVMRMMSMRLDVMQFGQCQCERRLGRLECSLLQKPIRGRAVDSD